MDGLLIRDHIVIVQTRMQETIMSDPQVCKSAPEGRSAEHSRCTHSTQNIASEAQHGQTIDPAVDESVDNGSSRQSILIFGRRMPLPASKAGRVALGMALVFGGIFAFLPILGLWMLPLGLLVLSVDFGAVRRWRRRLGVRYARWRRSRRNG